MNTCLNCGKSTKNPKYCSSSCSAIVSNSNRKRSRTSRCLFCNELITEGRWKKKYCSNKCQGALVHKKLIEGWLNGEIDGGNIEGMVKPGIRQYLYETRGEACEECGWNQINLTTGHSPLEIDHIDGDHKNNRPENLKILCPNCHALTSNYKALNKGNGRASRRK